MSFILVTGGTGLVGSTIARMLIGQGYSVKILRRENSNLYNVRSLDVEHCIGDVRDTASLPKAIKGCDTVFHTAAIVSFWRPLRDIQYDVNVIGTRNIVDACLKAGIRRLVHTSSIAALGHPEPGQLATESTAFNGKSLKRGYKSSKFLAEQEIFNGIEKGLDAVIVNPSVIIGPGDIHFNGGNLIRSIRKGLVPFYLKGGMNVVYVDDVANGEIFAWKKGRKGERYILCGENLTHREIFALTAEIVGGKAPRMRCPVPFVKFAARAFEFVSFLTRKQPMISQEMVEGAGIENWYSSEKAIKELGYSATPLRIAVEKTYRWYIENNLL